MIVILERRGSPSWLANERADCAFSPVVFGGFALPSNIFFSLPSDLFQFPFFPSFLCFFSSLLFSSANTKHTQTRKKER